MTKQSILDAIQQDIVQNDDGDITAKKVKTILDSIVSLLPSNDATGKTGTQAVVKDYLTAGNEITITEISGKLQIAFTGTHLDAASVRSIVDSHIKGGDDITIAADPDGNLVVSFTGTLDSDAVKRVMTSTIEVQHPVYKTYDETTKKLTIGLAGYESHAAFNNSAVLEPIRTINAYTPQAYNLALFDSLNVDADSFMLPPSNADSQGLLINLATDDVSFKGYFETGLVVGIYQSKDDGTNHIILEGTIRAINEGSGNIIYLALENTTRNDALTTGAIEVYHLQAANKIQHAIDNTKDDVARQQVQALEVSIGRNTERANTARIESAAAQTTANTAKTTADLGLARTQRLTHITPWMYDSAAKTIYIQWKPVKGLSSGDTLTIRIEGISKTYTLTEGLPDNDTHGLLIPFAATTSDSANIIRNAVNASAGHLLCSVNDATNGTTDYCWIPVVASMQWTALPGSSPYTIANHYKEFIVEYGINANKVFSQYLIRQQIPTTDKTLLHDTERPDGEHVAELGITMSLNTNTLTATVRQQDSSRGTFSIQNIYAR